MLISDCYTFVKINFRLRFPHRLKIIIFGKKSPRMKNIHLLSTVILMFSAISFTSCSDIEPIDPNIIINPNPEGPDGPGEPSTGDYWPAALNNEWVFQRDGELQSPMKMISINSIGGQTYYTFNAQTAEGNATGETTAVTRLRKSGGNYYLKLDDFVTAPSGQVPGSTTSGSETILLKDNVPVGGSWVSNYTQTTTYTATYPAISLDFIVTGTIMEKNISVTVLDEVYTDVIKTKYVQKVTSAAGTSESTSYYWFAKGVGPIKITTDGAGASYNSELVSYDLN